MKLRIVDAIRCCETGVRIPPPMSETLGVYVGSSARIDHLQSDYPVYVASAEARAQFVIEPGMSPEREAIEKARASADVARVIYGDILDNLQGIDRDLDYSGIPAQHPARKRLSDVLAALTDAVDPKTYLEHEN